jgi:hypothetical protein
VGQAGPADWLSRHSASSTAPPNPAGGPQDGSPPMLPCRPPTGVSLKSLMAGGWSRVWAKLT